MTGRPALPDHPTGLGCDLEAVLEQGRGDLVSLDGARILITGGTGFVGSWMLELLAWAAARTGTSPEVVVLSRDPVGFATRRPHLAADPIVTLLRGDVREALGVQGPFDLIVAGASANRATGDAASDDELRETARAGADLAHELLSAGVPRALYLSSGAAARRAPDAYGQAKIDAEHLLTAGPGPSRTVVARLYTFVGPYLPLDLNFAVGNFLAHALARRPVVVAGDGNSVRSYLYAADLAWWLWALAVRGEAGKTYDVGSPEAVTIRQLAQLVAALVEPALPIVVEGRSVPSSAGSTYVPDTTAAREIGLRVTWTLADALRRTYTWHLARGTYCAGRSDFD